jgi:hypothetical protein
VDGAVSWYISHRTVAELTSSKWHIVAAAPGRAGLPADATDVDRLKADVSLMRQQISELQSRRNDFRQSISQMYTRLRAVESKISARETVDAVLKEADRLSPPAWIEGSFQWAEAEARRLGMNSIQRSPVGHAIRLWELKSKFLSDADRNALDWRPC